MAGHLRKCEFSTLEEKALAAREFPMQKEKREAEAAAKRKRMGGGEDDIEADDEGMGGSSGQKKKRKRVLAVETSFSQSKLKVYKGLDIPFSEDHETAIAHQTLRATQSANLPERWTEDLEVMKLFIMLRSRAMDVIPSRTQLGGSLLKQAADEIDTKTTAAVTGPDVLMCTDGWHSNRKDAVDGVALSYKFKSLFIDILRTNRWGQGRGIAEAAGQLILGDYLKENKAAAALMGELIDFVNWINSHDKVRAIFDNKQQEMLGKVLDSSPPIHAAILNNRDDIVKAQVGAETNARKKMALEKDTIYQCNKVESNTWWDKLQKRVIPNLEHICYLTNISQSDHVRPDQFLLALAGLFLHFNGFSTREKATERVLGQSMFIRIEKRFKELDQVVFVLVLILNPFEKLSRFGDKAKIDVFKLSTELIALFKRTKSRPPKIPRTAAEQQLFDANLNQTAQVLNTAFMHVPIPPHNGSRRTPRSWLLTTLASLFAGVISNPITLTRRDRVVSEESLYMELLAAEHSDEEPDAGAQEGSGEDYDGKFTPMPNPGIGYNESNDGVEDDPGFEAQDAVAKVAKAAENMAPTHTITLATTQYVVEKRYHLEFLRSIDLPYLLVYSGMFSPTEPVPTPRIASSATDPIPLPDPPFETTRHHVATYVVELLLDRSVEAVTGGIYVIRGLRRDRAIVDEVTGKTNLLEEAVFCCVLV
ncbi:hypothetical protein DFH08DRAFT_970380 [Mycena albidolilacea]|uniref:DUF659 domain-containing protein n=1 Tax=Mycena albidolilacea TaxID=1033008 RepID=A0AAD6ZFR1_9AGAR|nr:hypothetical protein DFH08DRAFT_970380 [Mycena albidolilacea]